MRTVTSTASKAGRVSVKSLPSDSKSPVPVAVNRVGYWSLWANWRLPAVIVPVPAATVSENEPSSAVRVATSENSSVPVHSTGMSGTSVPSLVRTDPDSVTRRGSASVTGAVSCAANGALVVMRARFASSRAWTFAAKSGLSTNSTVAWPSASVVASRSPGRTLCRHVVAAPGSSAYPAAQSS